ncbi:nuclear transport factor 2 family protein [Streptomyces sp. NPDC053431]|uniref:nuclear transport factor 2 family protein n=1 Tax=Streptomyces sp. NPDC053431 TaxID=3365703 RepID=UPI0037D11FB8
MSSAGAPSKALARQFSAIENTDIQITEFRSHIFAGGTAACAYATTDYRGQVSGQNVHLPGLRLTLTLEHHDHSWRIVQSHWSTPADGSLLNPTPPAPIPAPAADSTVPSAGGGGFSGEAASAFAVYQKLAATVTKRLNKGTFDFATDITPHSDEQFIEIVDGSPPIWLR